MKNGKIICRLRLPQFAVQHKFSSKAATEISQEQLAELQEKGRIEVEPGKELHMHKFADGLFLWNKDVSRSDFIEKFANVWYNRGK